VQLQSAGRARWQPHLVKRRGTHNARRHRTQRLGGNRRRLCGVEPIRRFRDASIVILTRLCSAASRTVMKTLGASSPARPRDRTTASAMEKQADARACAIDTSELCGASLAYAHSTRCALGRLADQGDALPLQRHGGSDGSRAVRIRSAESAHPVHFGVELTPKRALAWRLRHIAKLGGQFALLD
jgi:hypothetical protein